MAPPLPYSHQRSHPVHINVTVSIFASCKHNLAMQHGSINGTSFHVPGRIVWSICKRLTAYFWTHPCQEQSRPVARSRKQLMMLELMDRSGQICHPNTKIHIRERFKSKAK